jgi:hypothetical protein
MRIDDKDRPLVLSAICPMMFRARSSVFLRVVVRASAVVAISFHGESMKPSGAFL